MASDEKPTIDIPAGAAPPADLVLDDLAVGDGAEAKAGMNVTVHYVGVGYDIIGGLLQGDVPLRIIAGVLVVKSIIWAVSLGSGTSGGVCTCGNVRR